MEEQAQQEPPPVKVLVDEASQKGDTAASTGAHANPVPLNAAQSSAANLSPPVSPSPPASPPSPESRRSPGAEDYYSSRPRHDRLGNPIPQRKHPSAMSAVYGTSKIRLPGDLGAKDPRRPKSPVPSSLPGDLGPNDPRRQSSRQRSENSSPAPLHHGRVPSDGSIAPSEGERLMKDPKEVPEIKEPERRDSDDDADVDNDNDTDLEDRERGRERKRPEPGRTTAGKSINIRDDSDSERETTSQFPGGTKPDPTKGESKIALLGEEQAKRRGSGKRLVHPSTAFDTAPSGISTPMSSDDESHSELRAAQKLSLTMSNVHSTPSAHRVMRQIIRGDYAHFQREAEEGRKRQRMYLVATDISPEAEHALEWTIGTVLRDGDTLFAVYAMDEETSGTGGEGGVAIGKGADMVKDTASIIRGLQATNLPSPGPSPLGRAGQLSAAATTDSRSRSRDVYSSAEVERRRALEDVSARCVRLLRKTRLQVRVVVEVFHCKSPRHMITEVIDFLSPTLVIIGSRGQSAVKGVLLGSFSNYLVTKSSVPVMVARKKLRKHSKTAAKRNRDGTAVPYQGSGRPAKFSNVIEAPKTKGLRVKSWEQVGID